MQITEQNQAIIISDTVNDFDAFFETIKTEMTSLADKNIIVDLCNFQTITIKQINNFLPLSKNHQRNNKSFIMVCDQADFLKITEKLIVVPTIQEAFDTVEIEDITRDLGF